MKIYHNINNFEAKNPVVTIGTFDGVHLGHQKVIARLKEFARKHNGESVIFTFHPHPRLVTAPNEGNLRLLTTIEEKKQLFEKSGIDHLIVYPFTKTFSELSYSSFVKNILVDKLKTRCLVVGYDHRFGKNREGSFEYLKECAKSYNFKIEKLDALLIDEAHVSSTRIRNALEDGDVEQANKFLGYRFTLHGTVVEGQRVGRKMGFPTANIEASDPHKLIPGYGVYAVEIILSGEKYGGMLNIGTRPTFNNNADNRSIEVHIFNFSGDIYNKEITLIFEAKIRDEKKFSGPEALVEQLKKDKETALEILAEKS
ncbi:riboflavin kinase / FMN adenylyltransferase [Tangfeifania diversioriginum]|uniref:Riboflavin biosynthesis protein n=1 Tax=Tangfeifania diversioriginum TaxID=1168035 RepID=A0A1M6KKA8_9BACT|nr:bifunctional riboflavin kinase/FAD synthetase [Tangfeifania diversioriginum]SHJ59251.1 riboflavin kinase / FMN adenylyltransferase [Tangfeifania diversioriginum]